MRMEMNEREEEDFLVSRIDDINRAIKEDPRQEKYLSNDLSFLEEDLQSLRQHKSLRAANRKIRKYLSVGKSNHQSATISNYKQK